MQTSPTHLVALALSAALLSGCAMQERSEFEPPALLIPQSWPNQTNQAHAKQSQPLAVQSAGEPAPKKWWTHFSDPDLNALIDQVLEANRDLALATLTLQKAQLEAGINHMDLRPQITGSNSLSYEKNLDSSGSDFNNATNFGLSYELDLWGRVSAQADAETWSAKASWQDRENTAQQLVVTTATLYWQVGYLQQRMALAQQNLVTSQQVKRLTENQYTHGSATRLDVLQSTQATLDQQLNLTGLQQQLRETQNALSLLLDRPLVTTGISIQQLPHQQLPAISAGAPSDLLLRRPDVKSSLNRLKSALASQDAVIKSYLPTFSLTGSLGTSSSQLLGLIQNPVATLGSGLTLPFLEWNEMKLNQQVARLDYQMAVIDYRETLYKAFEEVANLLGTQQQYLHQAEILEQQSANAKEIERLYASQYRNGASDMLDWLSAMENRRGLEASQLEHRYQLLVTQANLYVALGG